MVVLGFWFLLLLIVFLVKAYRNTLDNSKFWLRIAIVTVPLAYIASQAGWIVAEMGRQPWVIQDMLPTVAAVSHINATSVMITFWLFAVLFTALLIAELKIMFTQIKNGSK